MGLGQKSHFALQALLKAREPAQTAVVFRENTTYIKVSQLNKRFARCTIQWRNRRGQKHVDGI